MVEREWRIDEVEGGDPVSHMLVFDEGVAHEREDLVAQAVEFLETLPGVTEVEHVEREFVEIAARGVPASQLTEALRSWWDAAQQEKRPWMSAVDRAAGIVSDLAVAHGYRLHGSELTRVLDAELSHVISLDHGFGYGVNEHNLTVTADVKLALPDSQRFTVARYAGDLGDEAALTEAITGRVLPALFRLSTVDALLERWQDERSIAEGAHRTYGTPEARLHARILVSRGRLAEAAQVYQQDFERCRPEQRPHLLELAAGLGFPPVNTGTNPHLSVTEEATLAAWEANAASMAERLRAVTGLQLDGSRRSVDELWAWLRNSRDHLQTTFADATPALAMSYYGVHTSNDILSGQVPFEPWYRMTVELVTAYLGHVVMGHAPGTQWCLDGGGELAMIQRGGTGLAWRVITIVHKGFGAPNDQFHPRQLDGLVDDMVRWVNDERHGRWLYRPGVPA